MATEWTKKQLLGLKKKMKGIGTAKNNLKKTENLSKQALYSTDKTFVPNYVFFSTLSRGYISVSRTFSPSFSKA